MHGQADGCTYMVVVAHNMRDKMKHFMEFTVLNLAKKKISFMKRQVQKRLLNATGEETFLVQM